MAFQVSRVPRFGEGDDERFEAELRREPALLVLFHGRQCPYSHRFQDIFEAAARGDEAWCYIVRDVRSAGRDATGRAYGIDVTPTVIAFVDGKEWRRLEAREMIGITPHRFQEWLDTLDDDRSRE